MFTNDFDYDVVLVGKNQDNVINLVVVTDGLHNIRPSSDLAIVRAYVGSTQIKGEDVLEYIVYKNGEESTLYTDANLYEGQIIMYPNLPKGWVDESMILTVFSPEPSYEDIMYATIAENLTVNGITSATDESPKVKAYTGIVYKANLGELTLITGITDGVTNTNTQVRDFSITDANIYTYDYTKKANKGYRVEYAATPMSSSVFKSILSVDENTIVWANAEAEDVCAPIVILRTIDNNVTDVFYFVGEWTYDYQ